MMTFFNNIKFWYKNARPYSVPITVLSWLVVFCLGIKHAGNIFNGVLALFGVLLVHLSTNLSDDYFDYKRLVKDNGFFNKSKNIKCAYIRNGEASINDLRNVIIYMLLTAAILGGILLLRSGIGVIFFALAVLPIALFYSKLSSKGLGDIVVILAYGPLLFGGVYYVMTKTISWEVMILSFPCALFVETILYSHMFMDFDEDKNSGKTTLCTLLATKRNSLNMLKVLYLVSSLLIIYLAFSTENYYYLFTFAVIPMIIDLLNMLKNYGKGLSKVWFWHYPLDNWADISKTSDASFFLRFMYCRNISTWFMLILCLVILLK